MIRLASTRHSINAYSRPRQVLLQNTPATLQEKVPGWEETVGEVLLKPTTIYVKTILQWIKSGEVHAIAHVTGGGLTENIARVLPEGCAVVIQRWSWNEPPVFELIRGRGASEPDEMARVFNGGSGLTLIVAP